MQESEKSLARTAHANAAAEVTTATEQTLEMMLKEADVALIDHESPEVLWSAQELRRVLANMTSIARISLGKNVVLEQELAAEKARTREVAAEPEARTSVNLNEPVYVKLTDAGRALHKKNHEENFRVARKRPDYILPEEDENGISKWQLWHLFHEFGIEIFMGADLPFATDIMFNNREWSRLQRPEPKNQYEIYDRLREFLPLPSHAIRFSITMDAHELPILTTESYLHPYKKSTNGERLYIIKEKYEWIKCGSKGGFKDDNGAFYQETPADG